MKTVSHPSTHIATELVDVIRNVAAAAEQLQQLHPAQLAILQQQKWFQLFVPKKYNGLQLNLPEALQLEEALAWTDGSVGWTVTLCAGAGWFVGFIDPEIADTIFNKETICVAGSGKADGIAKITGDDYKITGYWKYATGANNATAFTANCIVEEHGQVLKNADGSSTIIPFIFFKDEVTIHKNWKPVGMIATGSNAFEVKAIVVPKNRAFRIDSDHAVLKYPVYQYPFLQLAETTLAVNSSGMALRFLELSKPLIEKNCSSTAEFIFTKGAKEIENARQLFYNTVLDSWNECVTASAINQAVLDNVSKSSRQLAAIALKIVDELYPYCGMYAANPETEINRVWRNLHTASQHSLFTRS